MTLHDLRVQLCRVQYGKHVRQADFDAVAQLLQTLADYDERGILDELLTSLQCGHNLQERLLIMRQWARMHSRNRLVGDCDAVINVLDAYRLGG